MLASAAVVEGEGVACHRALQACHSRRQTQLLPWVAQAVVEVPRRILPPWALVERKCLVAVHKAAVEEVRHSCLAVAHSCAGVACHTLVQQGVQECRQSMQVLPRHLLLEVLQQEARLKG